MSIEESVAYEAVFIGSTAAKGGLRECIGRRIVSPRRYYSEAERRLARDPNGWHGVVTWAALPDARSAADHRAALIEAHEHRHARKPSFRGSPGNLVTGAVKGRIGMLTWSGLHAMNRSCVPRIPTTPGVFLIAAVRRCDPPADVDAKERSSDERSVLHVSDYDHHWLHHLRAMRRLYEQGYGQG